MKFFKWFLFFLIMLKIFGIIYVSWGWLLIGILIAIFA